MADGKKKEIKWSHEARFQFRDILEFYFDRNQSSQYCDSLHAIVEKKLEHILYFPEWDEKIENSLARFVVVDKFMLIYDIIYDGIVVQAIRDARRDET